METVLPQSSSDEGRGRHQQALAGVEETVGSNQEHVRRESEQVESAQAAYEGGEGVGVVGAGEESRGGEKSRLFCGDR